MKQPPGFDALIARLRAVAGALTDPRTGDNTQYSMADFALAACSVFFTQCPSFLSFQQNLEQARGRNNDSGGAISESGIAILDWGRPLLDLGIARPESGSAILEPENCGS